ncbi:DNA recombination protein RmuC [Candidatus Pandoraea novymonadis]|uniref:DNA recombination protein RmuC n=1 Tax=Candidatus Pandoraea novymonadis TaxID=1808959 RepID=A0ABX5FD41_9BURK|nr:DNA recombination protein RmuC [Candidatus Pandoraea novymonadis]PSB91660.1 hypothetical protein BZL35_00877 [Candidatus Pandoraea novymonadis]
MILIALVALSFLVTLVLAARLCKGPGGRIFLDAIVSTREDLLRALERMERGLREEFYDTARAGRSEQNQQMAQFQQTLMSQMTSVVTVQNQQIDNFARQLAKLTETNAQQLDAMRLSFLQNGQQMREEQTKVLRQFGEAQCQQLTQLSEGNERRLTEVRSTIEKKLKDIEVGNAVKLEEMRRTVDEKLHATLEYRLGESFKLVSARLEQVHRGLGEMHTLAAGVGDLKRVLTNVKTRGIWGEVQLEALLEQLLTRDQFAKNVVTVPGSTERVEFAIALPGVNGKESSPIWLPIDAKFPREDYERLLDAQERADVRAIEDASKALEARVRFEARQIAEKYLAPPNTTDFALLFLPTEGLYAEVLRRPGLSDFLQRDFRVTLAGPTTLTALLNSLQMGFQTLAIERRSSEVWQVLSAVKTEFTKFGDVLSKTKLQLESVTRSIDQAEVRTRQMARKLKTVEAMPGEQAAELLSVGELAEKD